MTQYQDKLMKYPKIHALGSLENAGILDEIVVIQSKIDGANFRCRYLPEEDKLLYGSREQELSDDTSPEKWIAIRSYQKAFKEHKDKFIPNVIYFSESMQKHTISYPEDMTNTIGYDVFDIERNEFYHWIAAKAAFELIGIPFINVHYEGLAKNISVEEIQALIKKSPYRIEGDEGVVIKCYNKLNVYGRPLWAKIVDPLFKEQNKAVFKGQTPTVKTDTTDIINEYFTDARLIKAINRFRDNDEIIDMSLMPKLFKYISDDILSENILSIINDYDSIDFKMFKGVIAKTCAKKLKEYLIYKAT